MDDLALAASGDVFEDEVDWCCAASAPADVGGGVDRLLRARTGDVTLPPPSAFFWLHSSVSILSSCLTILERVGDAGNCGGELVEEKKESSVDDETSRCMVDRQ